MNGRADIICGTCAKGIGTISEEKVQHAARFTPVRGQPTTTILAKVADAAAIRCNSCEIAAQPKKG